MAKISLMFLLSLIREKQHDGPSHKPSSYHWSYDGMYGPDSWSKHYEYCGGQSQSPINIDTRYAEFDETLTEFNFTQFDVLSMPRTFNISNNGHLASALIPTDMYTSGGGLPGIFKTAEFHFHWGSKDDRGSEHGIDNRNYPLEMHIVHYNTKYGTLANAKSKPDGLAVLGVMFEVSEQDNDDFQPIVAGLKNIRHQGDRDTINDLNIANLLPKDKQSFYRYRGSLTTPPCYESVVWTVFAEPQKISVKQLAVLRHLILEEHGDAGNKHAAHSHASTSTNMVKYMVNNYRPFQPLHGRVVQKSFNRGTLSHPVEQHSAEEPVTAIKNNPKKNLDKFKNLAQPDNTFGPLNINTILSGANSFPGSPSHSVNSAHNDKKAAATKTRIAVNEQIADIKLQSANTALLKSQTDSSSLNQGPSVSIALPILNSNPTTTPVTVMLSTSPSDMTTKHLLNTMPTQKPTYSASRHAATDAGVRRIDVYNAAIRNSFPRPTPNSKLVHPIGNHNFQGHDRRFSVNGYGTTQVREVIPSNTHSIGQGAGPAQLTYNNGHSSYSRGIYIPSAAQYPHRNNNPSTINSNQGYHSPPNRQDIIVSGGPPNQEPRRPNPFRQHAPLTSSQFIPIPNRRPQPVPQPTTIPNPWLLDRAQPQRQELYGQLPPPGLFLSEPRAIDPYPRRQRPTTISKKYIFSQANPNPNHGLSIDRDILLRALQRIQAMKQTGSVKTTTTTTQSPVDQPYMLMNPSRDPVRVTNKFAHGIYDRYGAAYPSLGSAVARP